MRLRGLSPNRQEVVVDFLLDFLPDPGPSAASTPLVPCALEIREKTFYCHELLFRIRAEFVVVHQESPNGDSCGATSVHGNHRVTDGPKTHGDVDHLFRKAVAPFPNAVWITVLQRHPRVVGVPIGGKGTKGTQPGNRLAAADVYGIVRRLDTVDQQL